MRLYEIRDWLKTLDIATNYYSGRIDEKQEKTICVYNDRMDGVESPSIGGYKCKKSYTFKASVILQWTKAPKEAEEAANVFEDKLKEVADGGCFKIGSHTVSGIKILKNMYYGKNEHGLYQYLFHFDLIYSD